MLTANQDTLHFSFPEVHPDAQVTIEFQRTLRIPDDDKNYPLPPGLGRFPIKQIDDHADRVPADWQKRGGVMLPMYQSEALWVRFTPNHVARRVGISQYPFAIRIAAGKRSAVTGDEWTKKIKEKDYVTVPKQKWIDGFVVEKGLVKQFVAMPLGHGFTAEEQLTGKAEFGGIQIEVLPMKRKVFDRRFPERPRDVRTKGGILRGRRFRSKGPGGSSTNYSADSIQTISETLARADSRSIECCAVVADMGLGAGGSMKQEIHEDPYGIEDWKKKGLTGTRCFIHLANSIAWKAITTQDPPHTAPTAAEYTQHGYPWFTHYEDNGWKTAMKGTKKLKGLKSVLELGFQKGVGLAENESCKPKHVVQTGPNKKPDKKAKKGQVRDGSWAQ